MPSYNFRLRFNFAEGYRINSDKDEIELLVSSFGERIRLYSGGSGRPIKDCDQIAVIGGPYTLKDQAKVAAEKSKRALLYWAIEQRVGIDFGDGKQRSAFTKAGLAMLQKQHGCPVRNDIHGIDIYEHIEKTIFVNFNAKGQVGKHPTRLINTFQQEYIHGRHISEKQILASEIYTSSFFDVSQRSRFITLVTAIEALLERPKHSDLVKELVKEFIDKTQSSDINDKIKKSIIGSLADLQCKSITQAGRELSNDLLPNELFVEQSSADFFARCYSLRSLILHRGKVENGSVDILDLANATEAFVAKLLFASLKDTPKQS